MTIDFGIDLGTTNSAIAFLDGVTPKILKDANDADITPSAVYIKKNGSILVGAKAKVQMEEPKAEDDVYIEFKRRMGSDEKYHFRSANVDMSPEELSAEVLKSLKANAREKLNRDINAAVITVPAVFQLVASEATKKAAALAGFEQCPLLQEPVAAAIAYGLQSNSMAREYWLTFDFGGGTFDAAVMKPEDGIIQVVNHGGDNFLGGADIDWGIIENLVIPYVTENYNLPDFKRGNPQWRVAMAKIKRAVEEAKITLSRVRTTTLDRCVFEDANGDEVDLNEFELTQEQVAKVAEPIVISAVNKCKSVLKAAKLEPKDVNKVLLVGGPTKAPYFRDILTDQLGIPLDFSVDPMTVVAQGASVFAGTQELKSGITVAPGSFEGAEADDGAKYTIDFKDYKPSGSGEEFPVKGTVVAPDDAEIAGFRLEFVHKTNKWTSGSIRVNAEGRFRVTLKAEKDINNVFEIKLTDAQGNLLPSDPSEINYRVLGEGVTPRTTSDISIEIKNNGCVVLVPRGTEYPFKKKDSGFKSTKTIKRGEHGEICVNVLEGVDERSCEKANYNVPLGTLVLSADDLPHDLPLGSEIEVTLAAKEPGPITVEAYVPLLGKEFSAVLAFDHRLKKSADVLRKDFDAEQARIHDLMVKSGSDGVLVKTAINEKLERVNGLWNAVDTLEGSNQIQKLIIELRVMLDDLQAKCEIPEKAKLIRQMFNDIARKPELTTAEQRRALEELKQRLDALVTAGDVAGLKALDRETEELWRETMFKDVDFWKGMVSFVYQHRNRLQDQATANLIFERAARAMNANDLGTLKQCFAHLVPLMPSDLLGQLPGPIGDDPGIGHKHGALT